MSLAELMPDVKALTRDDKLRLMQALATDLVREVGVAPISLSADFGSEGDPDSDLSEIERSDRDLGIAKGDDDFASGRFRSLAEVKADKRSRFGLNV